MELTYDIAQGMIRDRVDTYPPVRELVSDPAFDQTLRQILDLEGIDSSLFSLIRFELMIVLTLYAPLNELAKNIAEDTNLSLQQSESLVQAIKAILIPTELLEDLIHLQVSLPETGQGSGERIDGRVAALRNSLESARPETKWPMTGSVATPEVPPPASNTVPDANNELRDELVLKPRVTEKITERSVPEPGTKPLTREEILRSLAAKRTLQSDVSALQQEPPK